MTNWIVRSTLILATAGPLSLSWSQPQETIRPTWSGETTLSTTIASTAYRGSGFAGQNYLINREAYSPAEGSFSTAGLLLKQSGSWKEWVSLEFCGAYSHSLGGMANQWGRLYALPASLALWDVSSSLYASIPLDGTRSLCIEPALGFALVAANLTAAYRSMPRKNWERLLFYGPTAGLYVRLALSPKVSLRVGGNYMASRLRIKNYWSGFAYTSYFNDPGAYAGKYGYRSRRGGLGALVEVKYLWKSWVQLNASVDCQSWSAGGKPANYGGPRLTYVYPTTTTTPMLSRVRFSWGADFTY